MALSSLGKATATQYKFTLSRLPVSGAGIHQLDTLKLNLFDVNVPGMSLDTSEMPWQGMKAKMHMGGITFDSLNINYVVDSEFKNWKLLSQWLLAIANNKDRPSRPADEYVLDASIILMDNWNNVVMSVIFSNLWIQSVGELRLSVRDGETIIESSAVFNYDYYVIK
jgi:hypothetical protein